MPLVAPQRAQKAAYNGRVGHAGKVLGLRLLKRSCEVLSGIPISTTRSDGVAEDSAGVGFSPMCSLDYASLFQLPKRS